MQYRVNHRYKSPGIALEAGAVVDLDEETAAFLERDSPGVLSPVVAARDVSEPMQTRQVTAPTGRRSRTTTGG